MNRIVFMLMLSLAVAGCEKTKPTEAAPTAVLDPMVIKPNAEFLAQIKVEPVSRVAVVDTLRVAGRIEPDADRVARIGASVAGRVTEIHAAVGQAVRDGAVLARINSSELSSLQLTYLKAHAQQELTRRNAERAKVLLESDVIGAAELQRRESEYQIAVAETRAAAQQLKLLGVSTEAISQLASQGQVVSMAPVISTVRGVVVERKLAKGQVVQPSETLFTVADLSSVWAVAQVPEQQIAQVQVGQTATIEVPALGNQKIVGRLVYINPTVDPDTRTVLVRTELDNRQGRLKPEMLASMLIEARSDDALVVPASAVVREDDEDHVFIADGLGGFRLVRVKLGPESQGVRPVKGGVRADAKIVVDGAFHLNNERKRQAQEASS